MSYSIREPVNHDLCYCVNLIIVCANHNFTFLSVFNSITNLVKIQYIEVNTSSEVNANGGTGTVTVTVTPLPTGYRYVLFERKGANGRIYNDKLEGNKLTLTAQNLRTVSQKVYMRCYLIYVPTSWSYVEIL